MHRFKFDCDNGLDEFSRVPVDNYAYLGTISLDTVKWPVMENSGQTIAL